MDAHKYTENFCLSCRSWLLIVTFARGGRFWVPLRTPILVFSYCKCILCVRGGRHF